MENASNSAELTRVPICFSKSTVEQLVMVRQSSGRSRSDWFHVRFERKVGRLFLGRCGLESIAKKKVASGECPWFLVTALAF